MSEISDTGLFFKQAVSEFFDRAENLAAAYLIAAPHSGRTVIFLEESGLFLRTSAE